MIWATLGTIWESHFCSTHTVLVTSTPGILFFLFHGWSRGVVLVLVTLCWSHEVGCWRRRYCKWYGRYSDGRESWCMAYRGRGILLELKDELILKIWWRGLNIIVLNINERMWPGVKWAQEARYKRRWNIIKAPKNQKFLNILLLQLGEKGEFMEKEGGF